MSTIADVEVRRYEYPSTSTGGWGNEIVETDGTRGGYEWKINFVENPGSYNGRTFPPGSGNVDRISFDYNQVELSGTQARIEGRSADCGLAASVRFVHGRIRGSRSSPLSYYQQPVEAEYILESLHNVGDVTTAGDYRYMEKIPGLYVSFDRDQPSGKVTYDLPGSPYDILTMVSPGDQLRFGGQDGSVGSPGDTLIGADSVGLVESTSGAPVLRTPDGLTVPVAPDREVFVGGDRVRGVFDRCGSAADCDGV